MSGHIAKSQIPLRNQGTLPPDASMALIEAKNLLKAGGRLPLFLNDRGNSPGEGSPLPVPSQGCVYYEKQVGQARAGDLRPRGSKRLVLEVNTSSNQVMEVYFTEDHYGKFTFVRIV
jgi:guanyl-specific ribonuclease Sa